MNAQEPIFLNDLDLYVEPLPRNISCPEICLSRIASADKVCCYFVHVVRPSTRVHLELSLVWDYTYI